MTPPATTEKRICQVNAGLIPLLVELSGLTLDPLNARKHPARSIAAIKASLKAYAQQKPIVTKNGTVIAGNGTVQAARELGWTHVAAIEYDRDDLSAIGYRLADNRTADLSTFDEGVVKGQLDYLKEQGHDAELSAFWTAEEQADLVAPDGDLEVEQLPSDASMLERLGVTMCDPKTVLNHGDVVSIGKHILVVCDPVNQADVWLKHMKGDYLFCPYPGPYVTLTLKAQEKVCLLIQPDTFIAGHIVDRWRDMGGSTK